jgi:nicotinate-nucleotide adenylyltransferase
MLLASEASHQLQLDEVRFVPTYISPHQNKSYDTDFERRYRMTELALEPFDDFRVDDVEQQLGDISYTVDTLTELSRRQPDAHWFFIIGADSLGQLNTWHQPDEILKLATLAVAGRPGTEMNLAGIANAVPISMPLIEISATDIRQRVREGIPIRLLVPAAVEEYIRREGLYRER